MITIIRYTIHSTCHTLMCEKMKIYVVGKGYMDLNQFRLKYLDKYLILFCSNYESFLICASSGEIIDRIRLEFDSSEIHEEFINFIRNTY